MIRMFPLLPIPCSTALIMTQLKLGSRRRRTNQSHGLELCIVTGLFFHLCFQLGQCNFHQIINNGVIGRNGILLPALWVTCRDMYSLHCITLCVSFITLNMTPLLVKTTFNRSPLPKVCNFHTAFVKWRFHKKRFIFKFFNSHQK